MEIELLNNMAACSFARPLDLFLIASKYLLSPFITDLLFRFWQMTAAFPSHLTAPSASLSLRHMFESPVLRSWFKSPHNSGGVSSIEDTYPQ